MINDGNSQNVGKYTEKGLQKMGKDRFQKWFKGKSTWIISVLLAAFAVFLCVGEQFFMDKVAYDVVLLGDSIIGNVNFGKGIAAYLQEDLGQSVFKGGFGGTTAVYDEGNSFPYSVGSQLSLVKVSEAIAYHDFYIQKAQINYGRKYNGHEMLDYFDDCIKEMSRVDFSKVKYLIIEHGTNDYNIGYPVDNKDNPYDIGTYGGALRYSIELLKGKYPNIEIILMTPTWCWLNQNGVKFSCDSITFKEGGILEEYADCAIEIAKDYGVYVLDNFHESGIGPDTSEKYLADGLHLSPEGQKLVADRLAFFINEIEDKN